MHNSNKWSNDPSLEKFAAVHAVFKCNVSKCKHSYQGAPLRPTPT